nr:DMT family transporter [Gluconacetobacter tumulisoli]
MACYGIVAALCAAALGEPLRASVLPGVILAIAGGVVSSIPPAGAGGDDPGATVARGGGEGVWLAALSACFYGAGFCVQGRFVTPYLGALGTVWAFYTVGMVVLLAVALLMRGDITFPGQHYGAVTALTGLLSGLAYLSLSVAAGLGSIALPTVLSSLTSMVTVLQARLIIREPVATHQWLGMVGVLVGLAVLNLG